MTKQEFIGKLAGYFGAKYAPGQVQEIAQWIDEVPPRLFTALWEAVKRVPLYGRPLPLVADLEAALEKARETYQAIESRQAAEDAARPMLPDEPYLDREEARARLQDIMGGLQNAKRYKPAGGSFFSGTR